MNTIFKKTALLIIFFSAFAFGQNIWQKIGTAGDGIAGAEAILVGSDVYIIGGYSDTLQATTKLIRKYDILSGKWSNVGSLAKARRNFSADILSQKIYCFGGESSTPSTSGTMEMFNLATSTSALFDSNKIFGRTNSAGMIRNGIYYIIGGAPYDTMNASKNPFIAQYNLSSKSITKQFDSTFAGYPMREGAMIGATTNNIYIFGGLYNTVLNESYRYNLNDNSLTKSSNILKQPRTNGRALLINNYTVVLFGGYNESNFALNTMESYTANDNFLFYSESLPAMNIKRKEFMAVYYAPFIYVFGGISETGQLVYDIERYSANPIAAVENEKNPGKFTLLQNYPNPFNPSTKIHYSLKNPGYTQIRISDVLGNVITESPNEYKASGEYDFNFNGANVSSGVYFYQLTVSDISGNLNTAIKKMVLMK